ncbi:MAG TPA: nucleotidyltransferase family protein, partial [Xanthobacteraceae bacterium]|nr:nucleotidyltransferase family protein [Xanthobacteraceae bacterium]
PRKSDIMEYFGARYGSVPIVYVVQPQPAGLCDSVFCAGPAVEHGEGVMIGLPDTVWFPEGALAELPGDALSFLLFPVQRPELFDAVVLEGDEVREIQVKQARPGSHWIWGAFKMPEQVFNELLRLWHKRERQDEYFGTLVNAYLAEGGRAVGVRAGEAYVDVGTLHGYREAMRLLSTSRDAAVQKERAIPGYGRNLYQHREPGRA